MLAFDAGDPLARMLEERGPLPLSEAAVELLALRRPARLASAIVRRALAGDARFALATGPRVALAAVPGVDRPLGEGRFAVLDLETSGLSATGGRIVEAACVVLHRGAVVAERELRGLPEVGDAALVAMLELTGDAVIVGHNLRFDISFLDARVRRLYGARLAAPLIDTLALARRLLRGRVDRYTLGALADFLNVPTEPTHSALPDARATAEVLTALIELAREVGARTVADLCALSR